MNQLPEELLLIIFEDMVNKPFNFLNINKNINLILDRSIQKERKFKQDVVACEIKYRTKNVYSGYACWMYYMQTNVEKIEDCPLIDYIITKNFSNNSFVNNIEYILGNTFKKTEILWLKYFNKEYPGRIEYPEIILN